MRSRSWFGAAATVLAGVAWLGAAVMHAQAPVKAARPGDIESDPIRCWWTASQNAIVIGERFTIVLTCGVIETSRITVVPDLNQIEPMTVQLTPFEVVDGSRHADILAPPWRYVQFEYSARLVGDAFFGQDVDIPSLSVTYNIQSVGGGTQGRDQTYVLPALPMRITSLVPQRAADIRDGSHETFADIEARRFRATEALVAAGVLFSFALVLVALAGVHAVGRYRERTPTAARPLPLWAVLNGCVRGAGRLRADVARDGWTPELAGRALTVFRIGGAVALGRPVAQALVGQDVPGRDGQLVLRKGLFRPRHALVSAPTTASAIATELERRPTAAKTRAMLEPFSAALRVFNAAHYSRNGTLDSLALDAALEHGTGALRRLRVTTLWPGRGVARPGGGR